MGTKYEVDNSGNLTAGGNMFTLGDGTGVVNKKITANNADVTKPAIQYDEATSTWQLTNDGVIWTAIGGGGSAGTPAWVKITKSYLDFSTAALTNTIDLYALPASGIIHGVKIRHSAEFTGTLIGTYTVSVGITGLLGKYATAFDVLTAASDTNFQLSNGFFSESHANATTVKVTATTVGANLSEATTGSVDIWLLVSVAS